MYIETINEVFMSNSPIEGLDGDLGDKRPRWHPYLPPLLYTALSGEGSNLEDKLYIWWDSNLWDFNLNKPRTWFWVCVLMYSKNIID